MKVMKNTWMNFLYSSVSVSQKCSYSILSQGPQRNDCYATGYKPLTNPLQPSDNI